MDSRVFIRNAAKLIAKLENSYNTGDETSDGIQKEINTLFAGLQNPTLPSAYKLRDAALSAGYQVSNQMLQRLGQFEYLS